jgi:hypothetical protein
MLEAFSLLFYVSNGHENRHFDILKPFVADTASVDLSLPADQQYLNGLDGIFNALEMIIAHEWWTRVWTIQEVALAQRAIILHYDASMEFNTLVRAANLMYDHFQFCCKGIMCTLPKGRLEVLETFALQARSIGLIRSGDKKQILGLRDPAAVFSAFRNRLSTDPRDKVNALLGLAKWTQVEAMKPSYSVALEELYTNAMFNLIQQGQGLALLRANSHHGHPELPSWVEDWSIPASNGRGFERLGDYPSYEAGGKTHLQAGICSWKRALVLKGAAFDIVTATGNSCTFCDDLQFFDILRGWKRIVHEHYDELSTDTYANGESYSQAFQATLEGDVRRSYRKITRSLGLLPRDYNRSRNVDFTYGHLLLGYNWWGFVDHNVTPPSQAPQPNNARSNSDTTITAAVAASKEPVDHWIYHLNNVIRPTTEHTRFFMTSKGYMGLGSLAVELGDLVFVPYGCEIPLVLRSRDLDNSSSDSCTHAEKVTFISAGTCYIHGIMDGEAIAQGNDDELEAHIL